MVGTLGLSKAVVRAALASVVAIAASATAAHAAISIHSGQAHVGQTVIDPGRAPGESVVLDFESQSMPKGFSRIDGAPGTFGFSTGNDDGVADEPSGDLSQYFYVG